MGAGMRATARSWTEQLRATVGLFSLVLLTAGCATPVFAPSTIGPSTEPEPVDRIHRQAHDALERWAEAVRQSGGASITFVGELTSQIGSWEAAVGGNNKVALAAGIIESPTTLSDDTPSRKNVKWVDGESTEVNVLSAAAALEDLVEAGEGACPECDPLLVTEATLATGLVETSVGPAEAPIWVYTIEGSAVRVTRVAVDGSVTVVPPPWNADHPPDGISIESAVGSEDARLLEVVFSGAVKTAEEPCGADYTAEAVESDLAVVVIVVEHRNGEPGGCRLPARTRTAEVRLDAVLGKRTVLEVRQGLPIPLLPPA